jgi:hypothetical protein
MSVININEFIVKFREEDIRKGMEKLENDMWEKAVAIEQDNIDNDEDGEYEGQDPEDMVDRWSFKQEVAENQAIFYDILRCFDGTYEYVARVVIDDVNLADEIRDIILELLTSYSIYPKK